MQKIAKIPFFLADTTDCLDNSTTVMNWREEDLIS